MGQLGQLILELDEKWEHSSERPCPDFPPLRPIPATETREILILIQWKINDPNPEPLGRISFFLRDHVPPVPVPAVPARALPHPAPWERKPKAPRTNSLKHQVQVQ